MDDAATEPERIEVAEDAGQRLDRELNELLGGLRVLLPGVQVLFAFLLTVAFAERFEQLDADAHAVYLTAVTLAGLASVLLIAPSVHHRLRFRDGAKEDLLRTANVLALGGATCLGLAIGCALYVVGDGAFPSTWARWIGPLLAVLAGLIWFVLPHHYRAEPRPPDDPAALER